MLEIGDKVKVIKTVDGLDVEIDGEVCFYYRNNVKNQVMVQFTDEHIIALTFSRKTGKLYGTPSHHGIVYRIIIN